MTVLMSPKVTIQQLQVMVQCMEDVKAMDMGASKIEVSRDKEEPCYSSTKCIPYQSKTDTQEFREAPLL